jgi:hypothetical protein
VTLGGSGCGEREPGAAQRDPGGMAGRQPPMSSGRYRGPPGERAEEQSTIDGTRGRRVMDWQLELVVVPVADVDRAKHFYSESMQGPELVVGDPDGNGWAVQESPALDVPAT